MDGYEFYMNRAEIYITCEGTQCDCYIYEVSVVLFSFCVNKNIIYNIVLVHE